MKNSNKKIILIVSTLIVCLSCKDNRVANFIVVNESKETIDSIKISCSDTDYSSGVGLDKLMPNESSTLTLNMSDVKKVDGNYFIELFKQNEKKQQAFGYYSNGTPTNSIYKCVIKNDTILITETMK